MATPCHRPMSQTRRLGKVNGEEGGARWDIGEGGKKGLNVLTLQEVLVPLPPAPER
jgi:hypothetical protein